MIHATGGPPAGGRPSAFPGPVPAAWHSSPVSHEPGDPAAVVPPPSGSDDAAPSPVPTEDVEAAPGRPSAGATILGWLREVVIVLVGAVVLAVIIKTFLVQAFFIPSSSMRDTLEIEDRVLVTRLAPRLLDVNRGDIVVFVDPGGWLTGTENAGAAGPQGPLGDFLTFIGLVPQDAGDHLIKRVVGVAGDTVECCSQGGVTVNGVPIEETYLAAGASPSEVRFSVVVPEGYLWVMGDNRQNSRDSRYHQGDPGGGAIPLSEVVGIAQVRVWPIDRWAVLGNPAGVFADVP